MSYSRQSIDLNRMQCDTERDREENKKNTNSRRKTMKNDIVFIFIKIIVEKKAET